jgi:ubiquinone/menaquinone biosynthesis C-methylase UbiE
MHTKTYNFYLKIVYAVWSMTDPMVRIADKSALSVLDLGCGLGNPARLLVQKIKVNYLEGVDVFPGYLKKSKELGIYNKLVRNKVENINYPSKSFDIVLASQVVEHLTKPDALRLIQKMEKIAKRQVIIVTPIGECYHPDVDHNKYQLHKSNFVPNDFTKMGYKIKTYRWRWLLDRFNGGFLSKTDNALVTRFVYVLNHLLTPIYDIFPWTCDYIFVAYKNK